MLGAALFNSAATNCRYRHLLIDRHKRDRCNSQVALPAQRPPGAYPNATALIERARHGLMLLSVSVTEKKKMDVQKFVNTSSDISSNSASNDNNIGSSGGIGTYLAGGLPPSRPPRCRYPFVDTNGLGTHSFS